MDLLCVCLWGGGGGCAQIAPPIPGQRGRGGAIFHDKGKNNRDKMRYSNLSNNMMIELQFKYSMLVGGRHT
jgi:hypothetical protein